jgi:uncharacterized protein
MIRAMAVTCLLSLGMSGCGGEAGQRAPATVASFEEAEYASPPAARSETDAAEEKQREAATEHSACDQADPKAPACRCERGDIGACLELADAAMQRRDHDLAILMTRSLCERGAAPACFRSASYLDRLRIDSRAGMSADQLRRRGMALYETQCAADEPEGCFGLGRTLFDGRETAREVERGLAELEKACDLDHAGACAFLGRAYASGVDVPRDDARADALLDKACSVGGAAACSLLAERVASRDERRARVLYEKACDGDDTIGCARSGPAHVRAGEYARAADALETACEGEHFPSCSDAADLISDGKGRERDPARARKLYRMACDEEVARGCIGLGALLAEGAGGERNWGEAITLYERACELGERRGCRLSAQLARNPPDWRCETIEACEARCEERIGRSCAEQGKLLARDERCSEARELYAKACALGDPTGCILAGDVPSLRRRCAQQRGSNECVRLGQLIKESEPQEAQRLFRRACDQNNGPGCRELALAMPRPYPLYGTCCSDPRGPSPEEVRRQEQRARERERYERDHFALLRKGCHAGDSHACWRLSEQGQLPDEERQAWKARSEELMQEQERLCVEPS